MTRQQLVLVLGGAATAVLMVSVASSESIPLFERYPEFSLDQFRPEAAETPIFQIEPIEDDADVFKIWEVDLPDVLDTILQVLLAAGLVALVVRLWKSRPRLRWRRARAKEVFDVLDDLPGRIAADAAEQRRALLSGSPRNAIVECWLRLEALTAASGFERHPADTSQEFTERVLGQFRVDQEAIRQLAELYREARFSSHPIGETERERALATLETLHASLVSGQADADEPAELSS